MAGEYTYLKRVKVNTAFLKPGMYVAELDKPWEESSFLFQGFPLNNEADVLAVQSECTYVYVDFKTRQQYQNYLKHLTESRKPKGPVKTDTTLSKELPRAQRAVKRSSRLVKDVMDKIMLGQDFDLEPIKEVVADCVDSILKNDDTLMMLMQVKEKDEYTAEHCMRVGIMCIAFGKYLGMGRENLEVAGIAGMLHDVGKMQVPPEILNKPGKLSPDEFTIMKEHTVKGYELLLKKRKLAPAAVDVAYAHHERIDGSGYPRGLPGYKISKFARMIAIIDAYDAITSDRCYKKGQPPSEAFRILLSKNKEQYDQVLARRFVEFLGVYPVGSLVEMKTGELGFVIRNYERYKLRPRVLLVTDENKQKGFQKVVDLSKSAVHSSGELYQIKCMHPNGHRGCRIEDYIAKGLKLETTPKK